MLADGFNGLPAHAPYDRILVTAAPAAVPRAWLEQLGEGGLLLVPFPLRGSYLSITLRLRREDEALTEVIADLSVLDRDVRPVQLLAGEPAGGAERILRQVLAHRGSPQTAPSPELREPVSMEINLLIFALLEFETRAISIPAFNVLGEADARRVVETISWAARWD